MSTMSLSSATEKAPAGEGLVFWETPRTRRPSVLYSWQVSSISRRISSVMGSTRPWYST